MPTRARARHESSPSRNGSARHYGFFVLRSGRGSRHRVLSRVTKVKLAREALRPTCSSRAAPSRLHGAYPTCGAVRFQIWRRRADRAEAARRCATALQRMRCYAPPLEPSCRALPTSCVYRNKGESRSRVGRGSRARLAQGGPLDRLSTSDVLVEHRPTHPHAVRDLVAEEACPSYSQETERYLRPPNRR